MITLNGHTYYLCLLDTNIISELLKDQNKKFPSFCKWAFSGAQTYIPSFSIFTILELRQSSRLYTEFCNLFSVFPCIILKGHEELIQEEISSYPNPGSINPVSIGSAGVTQTSGARLDTILNTYFSTSEGKERERKWLQERQGIVDGITALVKNFPPEKGKYTKREIRSFLEITVFEQIALRDFSFARSVVDEGKALQIDAFPSLKMTAYTVFYKFYNDHRKPEIQDAFDIIISTATPYVDTVITEQFQAEVIKKVKRLDTFLDKTNVLTLRDFS